MAIDRLQIHVRDGWLRLYTINGADCSLVEGKMKNVGKHFKWRVRTQQEDNHFRIYYQHDYPHGTVETRDTRRFNSLAEAEGFAETMRLTNRIYTHLGDLEKS